MSTNHNIKRGAATRNSIQVSSHDGLMPDPETLKKLEEFIPGAGERWMALASLI